jgi:hypothetical protein
MTHEERVQAVIDFGFTERQARFVVLVLRHGGVCVPRQYASFAGIANGGRRCNAFFDRLVRRGYAHEIGCVHNRARLYHLHHKPLTTPSANPPAPISVSTATGRLLARPPINELSVPPMLVRGSCRRHASMPCTAVG